ncbi:hypothetical protein PAECIP111893_03683 [Paenibacillus plantiphilus]|uniref:PilZ domain-containing protein n=1 Tax=Paenibacillus plantiphilus TaxID=2905650 RepID=A0ABM9CHM4_9BACL|nr:hypothetical protein PAECIP111893_03683 [Paenibacillus plantiphilus]
MVVHLRPVKQRSLFHMVRVKELHLDIQQLSLGGLGLDIHNGLLVIRTICLCVWVEQDNLRQGRLACVTKSTV